jgi:hypothetical protein
VPRLAAELSGIEGDERPSGINRFSLPFFSGFPIALHPDGRQSKRGEAFWKLEAWRCKLAWRAEKCEGKASKLTPFWVDD